MKGCTGGFNKMIDSLPRYFKYWGKADPKYEGEPVWHPLVYHCLDVAAVSIRRREVLVADGQRIGKPLGKNMQLGQ